MSQSGKGRGGITRKELLGTAAAAFSSVLLGGAGVAGAHSGVRKS